VLHRLHCKSVMDQGRNWGGERKKKPQKFGVNARDLWEKRAVFRKIRRPLDETNLAEPWGVETESGG